MITFSPKGSSPQHNNSGAVPLGPSSLEILYKDQWILAINKPAWLVVHRGLARDKRVVVDIVKEMLNVQTVHPMHRLDRQTSGVLLFALDPTTANALQNQFINNDIQKRYLALVRGIPPQQGKIDSPVPKKEDGERVAAQTNFERYDSMETTPRTTSLVWASPHTGRFHQIRRHLKHIDHPIIGDANYGKGKLNREFKKQYGLERMALHAASLSFVHPTTNESNTVHAPLPIDLEAPLKQMGFELPKNFAFSKNAAGKTT